MIGNLTYQNSDALIEIGATTMCPGNTVGGNLQIGNKRAAVGIVGNIVGGNLQIQNDAGSTLVFSNNVAKNLQCSGNTTITGSGNSASQKQGECSGLLDGDGYVFRRIRRSMNAVAIDKWGAGMACPPHAGVGSEIRTRATRLRDR